MSDNIPSGVITEILDRLSRWDLCRLRCVCKEWRSIIDDPSFVQRQLLRSTSLFLHIERELYLWRGFHPFTFGPNRKEEEEGPLTLARDPNSSFPFQAFGNYGIMGSCHGLLCLGGFDTELCLLNPVSLEGKRSVTLERLMMRDPLLSHLSIGDYYDYDYGYDDYPHDSTKWVGYGFGYDEVVQDYKAVILLKELDDFRTSKCSYILSYGFRTKSFSVCIANDLPRHSPVKHQEMGVLLRSSLHWIFEPNVIRSFDLRSNVFGTIRQPNYSDVSSGSTMGVGVVDSCLCVCAAYGKGSEVIGGGLDVWVMKEYRNEDSWCILYSVVGNPVFDEARLVMSLGRLDGQILMLVDGIGFTWVDPKNGSVEVVPLCGVNEASKFEAVLCLESPVKTFPASDSEKSDEESDYDDLTAGVRGMLGLNYDSINRIDLGPR